ncbi:MAG TPA: GNAT family N-acetyltransferase [Candidatus Binataceae bacterium]|nr:GNAT family N-acetyltransferase [Candidatus Binataceae bacterium]
MKHVVIATARLDGEPLDMRHFAEIRTLHSDPRVMATLSVDGKPFDESQSRAFLERSEEHWRLHGFGFWAFHDRAGGGFVGYCGLRHTTVEGKDEIELGYAVASAMWRKGFAFEMSQASLRDGFERLRLDRIVAFTLTTNNASRRTMEKLGFTYERDIIHAGLQHVLYQIDERSFTSRGLGALDR